MVIFIDGKFERPLQVICLPRKGEVTIGNYDVAFLPPEVFYKQLNKIKANGEKTFKPLDKAPSKRNCLLHNFLVLNE